MPYKMGRKKEIMDIKRFYAYTTSVEVGRKEIKQLIDDTNKAKKEIKYFCTTDIKINLTGILFGRTISLERIENLKIVKDELKISFSSSVHDNNSTEIKTKDVTIGIPISIINMITVEVK